MKLPLACKDQLESHVKFYHTPPGPSFLFHPQFLIWKIHLVCETEVALHGTALLVNEVSAFDILI